MNTEKLHELCARLRPLAKKYRAALIVLLAGVLLLAFVLLWLTPLWETVDRKYYGAPFGRYAKAFGIGFGTLEQMDSLSLITQVALGMAAEAAELSDGHMVRNVVLFSVLVYELIGPTLTKLALTAAGEIIPEGRTSARTANKPEVPVSLD